MSFAFQYHQAPLAASRSLNTARYRYEAARSFDLDDDLEFCPVLLSDEELQSVYSGSSDRSSNSSGSPDASPLQRIAQPSSAGSSYSLFSQTSFNTAAMFNPPSHLKLQQPPTPPSSRTRNAIPIVNPNTGMRVSSPPFMTHIEPRPQHQSSMGRRW